MKKVKLAMLSCCIATMFTYNLYGKAIFCTGADTVIDNGFVVYGQVSFSTQNGCCSPASGSALVSKSFFMNGMYLGTSSYYISISDAQQAIGCQYV
ncbi:hypothetical protein [Dyadobacter sandarakinus]|uniref:Uncharacterized protein n=1 Tax=Dyadobacter sandarakinus TaxID=2747268 RepID=A0ABX7I714_9BACT|nr:hypothetical protein [Dyadobacter sandarakinus]QRR01585.1 hypothetical protein HWI92_12050 [Dyadobacter sandarakinus]